MEYKFLPIALQEDSIEAITTLLQITFPTAKKYTKDFVKWQYVQNPVGPMIGYNAYLGSELAAHYALMPIKAFVGGKEEMGLLSLNTATHPEHRGKRLFTVLAQKSYEAAMSLGYSFVIGVANANSTPGFLKKLNFQLVGSLEAKLGFGRIAIKPNNDPVIFEKIWDNESINWRLSNPSLSYKVKRNSISAVTDKFGVQAILKEFSSGVELMDNQHSLGIRPLKIWIGIDHNIDWGKSFYFAIPKKFRPSPLNLIFKDLTGENRKFEFSKVRFHALDFDAY